MEEAKVRQILGRIKRAPQAIAPWFEGSETILRARVACAEWQRRSIPGPAIGGAIEGSRTTRPAWATRTGHMACAARKTTCSEPISSRTPRVKSGCVYLGLFWLVGSALFSFAVPGTLGALSCCAWDGAFCCCWGTDGADGSLAG